MMRSSEEVGAARAIGAFLLLLLAACDDRSVPRRNVDMQGQKVTEHATEVKTEGEITFAVAPVISPEFCFSEYELLSSALSKGTGKTIRLIQRKSYEEINELFRNGKCDFGLVCGGAFIRATLQFPLKLVAIPRIRGSLTYRSCIVVREDSDIRNITDLRGKNFAFCDPLSNSGYAYPTYRLMKMGLDPSNYFGRTIFTYGHDKTVRAVIDKVVDAGAVAEIIVTFMTRREPDLANAIRIIDYSPEFTNTPVVARNDIPQETLDAVKKSLLAAKTNTDYQSFFDKTGIEEFCEADDQMFKTVSEIWREIGTRNK